MYPRSLQFHATSTAASLPLPGPSTQPTGSTHEIGAPLYHSHGQFGGRTIHATLEEIQKADLGRKYARVDRRPLDPPPVVRLRYFDHHFDNNNGTEEVREFGNEDYKNVDLTGFVCSVDLFAIETVQMQPTPAQPQPSQTITPHVVYHDQYSIPSTSSASPSAPLQQQSHVVPYESYAQPARPENKLMTAHLVGSTFVQPHKIDWNGSLCLMFVFSDLAVKLEGRFRLRYRVFDVFSQVGDQPMDKPMQAECYGGPFKVYSTKEFPGLKASTELTKHIARYGVRLNLRDVERRRTTKRKDDSQEALEPPDAKRRKVIYDHDGGEDRDDA